MSREVHPVADLFPMLAAEELAELAEDIRARGLLHPIVLDDQGRVLDGRNRLAACKIAKVEPEFVNYEGGDPDGYALAVNIARRHLTTGARAILTEQARRLDGGTKRDAEKFADLQTGRLSEAAVVLDWCDATVIKDVIAGTKPLSKAVEEARRLKQEDADRESKKARLRDGAPDLLARVGEGLDLDDAIAALAARDEKARQEAAQRRTEEQERERKQAENQRDARALLARAVDLVAPSSMTDGFVDTWIEQLGEVDADLIKRTELAGEILLDLAERIKQ